MPFSKRCGIISFLVAVVVVIAVGVGLYFVLRNHNNSPSKGPRAVDSLKFLVLVTRHGNRSPLYPLPNDPYPGNDSSYWPYGDNLSVVGRQQLYNLGVKLRSLYNGFLNPQFFNNEVYVSSTNSERVVQSGKCLMAGLYPPSEQQIWNKDLLWQPVPVHQDSLDKTQDKDRCRRFNTLLTKQQTEFRARWADNITYFNNYTSTYLNTTISGSLGVLSVWDALISDEVEGLTLPDWTATIFPDAMYPMMNDMYVKYVTANDEMTRLVEGPLFVVMMDVLTSKVKGILEPDRDLYYWSGHDDTLIALQAIAGVPTEDIVGVVTPGSAMLFELHYNSTTQRHFLEVLYVNGLDSSLKPKPLWLSYSNSTSCDYEVFVENTLKFTNITGSNYDDVCRSTY